MAHRKRYGVFRGGGTRRQAKKSSATRKAPRVHKARVTQVINPGSPICHPRLGSRDHGHCLPAPILAQMRRKSSTFRRGGSTGSESQLRAQVQKELNCHGKDDRCLVEASSLPEREKKRLLQKYFRTEMPLEWESDPDKWLDSDNIANVMRQYEETYPHFKFLGVVPIDFAAPDPYARLAPGEAPRCMNNTFCHINLAAEAKAGKNVLGAIFNLDPHYKGGSHWVGLAIDIKRHKVFYFDSYGMPPPPQIARLMRSLTLQDSKLTLETNGRRFQFGNSECGMYSMYFLVAMIQGKDFLTFVRSPVPDQEMLRLRKIFFVQKDD